MEQILAFAIGVGAALILWGVVVAFKAANRLNEVEGLLGDLEQAYDIMDRKIDERDQLINQRIDEEINRTDRLINDVYSSIDSRIDKLDAKFCRDGKALTEKSREFLKG
jgi:hypothetical protein